MLYEEESYFTLHRIIPCLNCLEQIHRWNEWCKLYGRKSAVSFACTDSTILLDNQVFNFDMVRIGIGLVGGAPNKNHPIDATAKTAIEIHAKISQIKAVKKGQTIGYGGSYTAKRDMKIALAHIGYNFFKN